MASKYTLGNFKLKVKKSKTGKGLYTLEDIPKGKCIIEYFGKIVPNDHNVHLKYLFEVGKGVTIDGNVPQNTARFINHSCRPNCEAEGPSGKVFIMSKRKIKPGEELTYDYGEEYFNEHIKPFGCKCVKCLPK